MPMDAWARDTLRAVIDRRGRMPLLWLHTHRCLLPCTLSELGSLMLGHGGVVITTDVLMATLCASA